MSYLSFSDSMFDQLLYLVAGMSRPVNRDSGWLLLSSQGLSWTRQSTTLVVINCPSGMSNVVTFTI